MFGHAPLADHSPLVRCEFVRFSYFESMLASMLGPNVVAYTAAISSLVLKNKFCQT